MMSFLLLILVYEVVSGDFDCLSLPHLQPKSKDLGLQAATTQVQAWPVAAHHSKERRGSRPSPCIGMCANSGPEVSTDLVI